MALLVLLHRLKDRGVWEEMGKVEIKVFGEKAEALNEHSVLFVKEIRHIEGRKVVILEEVS